MVSDVEIYAFINESLSNESIPLSLENVEAGFPLPNGGQIDKRLLPKNQEYSPIRLEDGMEVKILGPVVSVIRKYK